MSRLLQLKSFIAEKMPLTTPSDAALMLLKAVEAFFALNREAVLNNRARITALKKAVLKVVKTDIPDCHSIPSKLVHCFLHTRVHLFLKKLNERISEETQSPRCGSRSVGMREAAKAVN